VSGEEPADELVELAAPQAVERLGRSLASVPRGKLREVYLEERVREVPIMNLVRILACAQRESVRGVVEARVLVETFATIVQSEHVDPQRKAALMTAAVMLNEDEVVPLLGPSAQNDSASPREDRAKRGSLAEAGETLGRRKSLARTATGDMLLRILDDPHPEVIRNVLMNPAITEALVVRVAARRPVPPAVLEVVAKSKYGNRRFVRRALAMNPDTPTKLACMLVATMTAHDLHDVLQVQGLAPEVRNAARNLIKA
jgi:hypothetical protein